MYEIRNILDSVLLYIPNILKALILFLIAWAIAVVVKKLLEKALVKMRVGDHLAKGRTPADPAYGKDKVKSIAQVGYFLVFLLFIPSILDALDMEAVSGPISNMMQNLLAFIPRLIGAGVILFIGYFVAKIIKDLLFNFLQTVNIDKWYNKLTPKTSGASSGVSVQQKNTLADVLSKLVFGIVLIPVITMALETLNVRTLTEPILEVLNKTMRMIPNIFVAIILVVIGYYIATFIAQILEKLLAGMGIDRVYNWMEDTTDSDIPKFSLSKIIGNIVKVLIILFISVEALRVLKLDVLNTIGFSVISYLPLIISGLIIIGLGIVGGYFVEGLINKYAKSPFTAAIAKYIIIVFAVFMTLEQIKFASSIVNIAFLLVLGGLSVAFALAFGLGGRDFARNQLQKFEKKVEEENQKPVPENNPIDKAKEAMKNKDKDTNLDYKNASYRKEQAMNKDVNKDPDKVPDIKEGSHKEEQELNKEYSEEFDENLEKDSKDVKPSDFDFKKNKDIQGDINKGLDKDMKDNWSGKEDKDLEVDYSKDSPSSKKAEDIRPGKSDKDKNKDKETDPDKILEDIEIEDIDGKELDHPEDNPKK